MVKRGTAIEAHQWQASDGTWLKVGDVIGGASESQNATSSGRVMYEGKVEKPQTLA